MHQVRGEFPGQPDDDECSQQRHGQQPGRDEGAGEEDGFDEEHNAQAEHHEPGNQLEDPSLPLAELSAAEGGSEKGDDDGKGDDVDGVVEREVEVAAARTAAISLPQFGRNGRKFRADLSGRP